MLRTRWQRGASAAPRRAGTTLSPSLQVRTKSASLRRYNQRHGPRPALHLSPPPPLPRASFLDDPIEARAPSSPSPDLINGDLAPTPASGRTLGAAGMAALWVSLVISTTTLMLAGSLVDLGMNWSQGIATVFIGNTATLVPLVLSAAPGTRYGIPFPVLARASFGVRGASVPAVARALVACGWFGINTHIGGNSIYQILQVITGNALTAPCIAWLGLSLPELACFAFFWALQVAIITRGIGAIKAIEKASAPVLVALALALLGWALSAAGGPGPLLSAPSRLTTPAAFAAVFVPSVTAQVGYWATLALNVSDISRYATSQRAQAFGQAAGLPPFMAAFSLVGLAVAAASGILFGKTIVDPVELLGRIGTPPVAAAALLGLLLATLTTNIAANVVGPANALANAAPRLLGFRGGAVLTAVAGAIIMPWRLLATSSSFVGWLVAYSALLGPVLGVIVADYFIVRRRKLDIDALYSSAPGAAYHYTGGVNFRALAAVAAGVAPCAPGAAAALGLTGGAPAAPLFAALYDAAWFVGAGAAAVVYVALMARRTVVVDRGGEGGGGGQISPSPA